MAKRSKKKTTGKTGPRAMASYQFTDVIPDDDTDPLIVITDDKPVARNIVAVGQHFWLLPKGHRRKARPVQVARMVGGGDTVTIRCLDNGEKRVLPLVAFATAGSSRVLRA